MPIAKQPTDESSAYIGASTLASLDIPAREYVERRWLAEVKWFAAATRRSRRTYFSLSVTTLISSALTALLAGVSVSAQSEQLRWVIAFLGLISAISTGLLSLFQASPNWKRRSITLERLKSEGNQFFTRAGRYSSIAGQECFGLFVGRIEDIIYAHKSEFFAKESESPPDEKLKLQGESAA